MGIYSTLPHLNLEPSHKQPMGKLTFACAQNDHFWYGKVQSLIVANGHLNIVCLVKGVCQPTFICWQALREACSKALPNKCLEQCLLKGQASRNHRWLGGNRETILLYSLLESSICFKNTLKYSLPIFGG